MNDLTVVDLATLLQEAARQTWPVPTDLPSDIRHTDLLSAENRFT
jgi:hypothetical protein